METHLTGCAACRAEIEALRRLRALTAALPREISPSRDLWPAIATEIASGECSAEGTAEGTAKFPRRTRAREIRGSGALVQWFVPLAVAAAVVFFALFADRSRTPRSGTAWAVSTIAGAPRLDARRVHGEAKFHIGQWLETDAASRARVTVGEIGQVSVEPNSRLRFVGAAATDHRLELARGELHAVIWAPPRIFFVDTPSATAVDLGCAYTLSVNDAGDGELRVQTGYVALEHGDRESIIRSGYMCLTRRGAGPGTPFAEDAPEPLRAALREFDFTRSPPASALREILRHARAEDTITLWHLLARTTGAARAEVYAVLARLGPPPEGVTREGILSGDTEMRQRWGNHLGVNPFAAR